MTKTIILGIVIAGILGIGITTAYAGTTITMKGTVDTDGNQIKNVGAPTVPTDAATKGYVDSVSGTFYSKMDSALALNGFVNVVKSVFCDTGDIATGGGWQSTISGNDAITVSDDLPVINQVSGNPVGWTVNLFKEFSATGELRIWVICFDLPPAHVS